MFFSYAFFCFYDFLTAYGISSTHPKNQRIDRLGSYACPTGTWTIHKKLIFSPDWSLIWDWMKIPFHWRTWASQAQRNLPKVRFLSKHFILLEDHTVNLKSFKKNALKNAWSNSYLLNWAFEAHVSLLITNFFQNI